MAAGSQNANFNPALARREPAGQTAQMDYRPAIPADLAGVKALLSACALPSEDLTPALLEGFRVAVEAGVVVGCVGLERVAAGALLRSLAVQPAHRGRGIAARLCDEAEELARAAGTAELYLLTTSAADYFTARGYRRVEREALPASVKATAQFQTLCPASAVAMHKSWPGDSPTHSKPKQS